MKKFLFFVINAFVFVSCDYGVIQQKDFTERLEKAYFEGQRDVINGDVRIKMNKDSCFVWTKSPWDNKDNPIYIPTYFDTKNGN
jgi:hypothetical protein